MKQQKQGVHAIVSARSTIKQGEVTNQQLVNGFEK